MEPRPRQLSIIGFILAVSGLLAACVKTAQIIPPAQTLTVEGASVKTVTLTPEPIQPTTSTTMGVTPTTDCRSFPGEIREDSLVSDALGKPLTFKLYLPPCYEPDTGLAYPVLYLLHGLEADMHQWVEIGLPSAMDILIASGEVEPFIIVMPSEPNAYPPDISVFPEVLVDELIPFIDAKYATLARRQSRALGGNSRGSAWALRIGLDHPELFSSIGMHSLTIFNGDASTSLSQLKALSPQEMPRLFADIGNEDRELKAAQAFELALNEALVPHTWYQFSGTHDLAYWQTHLPIYLHWYASGW